MVGFVLYSKINKLLLFFKDSFFKSTIDKSFFLNSEVKKEKTNKKFILDDV